jgi:UDP-N-acetylglucosamine 4-epimerase
LPPVLDERLRGPRLRWLVTGSAGFIGSNLVETLLDRGQEVIGLDNFATGYRANLDEVRESVSPQAWQRHQFIEGDVTDPGICRRACRGVDIVLHQAALGSVPRSIDDPLSANAANVTGFLNMLVAAREAGVRRVVYASSSAVYGDSEMLPKAETQIGEPLSPYAATKRINEMYASLFARCYGLPAVGLRYFNVFGKRQDPNGAYAAVIPRWIDALLRGEEVSIYGDGETSRDFCHVANAVQANLLAALTGERDALNRVFNVAVGERTSLNELFATLRDLLRDTAPGVHGRQPSYQAFRAGDVRHSQADIGDACRLLGYAPTHDLRRGLAEALPWYLRHAAHARREPQRRPADALSGSR